MLPATGLFYKKMQNQSLFGIDSLGLLISMWLMGQKPNTNIHIRISTNSTDLMPHFYEFVWLRFNNSPFRRIDCCLKGKFNSENVYALVMNLGVGPNMSVGIAEVFMLSSAPFSENGKTDLFYRKNVDTKEREEFLSVIKIVLSEPKRVWSASLLSDLLKYCGGKQNKQEAKTLLMQMKGLHLISFVNEVDRFKANMTWQEFQEIFET